MAATLRRLSTGLHLQYAEQGPDTGQPLIFLHGWPDSWFSFSRVMSGLSDRVRAVALDQRGFGDSERPARGYAVHDFASDVVALLDELSIDRATIVGHSFGSFVARRAAIAYPDRIAQLVLIGTGLSAANPVTREVQASISDLRDPVPPEFARQFQAGTAHVPLPGPFFERLVAESLKLPARLWREVFDELLSYADEDALGRIEAPTLVLWGDRDALFSREDQQGVIARIPHASLKVYQETGHCPNWERPELVAADLDAFLAADAVTARQT